MEELIVITKSSSSGSTHQVEKIFFDENLSPKSQSAGILLKDYLRSQDEDFINSTRHQMIEFSRSFLTEQQEKLGSLTCKYCEKPNLIIEYEGMRVPRDIKATIDHVVPLSDGCDPFDKNNIVVACEKCNSKKGSKSAEEFMLIIKDEKSKKQKRIERGEKRKQEINLLHDFVLSIVDEN